MAQLQVLNLLLIVAGVIGGAVVIIAQYRKVQLERAETANRVWADAVSALKAHVDALMLVQKDKESEIQELREEIGEMKVVVVAQGKERQLMERDRGQLTRRNIQLFELVQECRARLARHGEIVPEPDGGE